MTTNIEITDRPNFHGNVFGSKIDELRMIQIHICPTWGADWIFCPECEAGDLTLSSVSGGIDQFTFNRRYGKVRFPTDSPEPQDHDVAPWNELQIEGAWVCVSWWENKEWVEYLGGTKQIMGEDENGNARYIAFIGQIQTPQSTIHGGGLGIPSGVQSFTAYGAADYLRRMPMTTSLAEPTEANTDTNEPQVINWVMSPNYNKSGEPLRNKSLKKYANNNVDGAPDTCVFGDNVTPEDKNDVSDFWSASQYLIYLNRVILKPGGIPFKYEIESELGNFLDNQQLKIRLTQSENILSVLQKMFYPAIGLDFWIHPVVDSFYGSNPMLGFAIRIFSVASRSVNVIDTEFPRGQTNLQFSISDTHALGGVVSIARNNEQRYKYIRMLGNRIKVFATFSLSPKTGNQSHGDHFPRLVPAWSPADESDYKKALYSGNDLPTEDEYGVEITGDDANLVKEEKIRVAGILNDRYRQSEQFKDVFSLFTVADDFHPKNYNANPEFDKDGNFVKDNAESFQKIEFEFLQEVPRFQKVKDHKIIDRSKVDCYEMFDPSVNNNEAESKLIVRDLEQYGIHFETIPGQMAVRLIAEPKHVVCDDKTWQGAGYTSTNVTNWHPYIFFLLTLCWESDYRIAYQWENNDTDDLDGEQEESDIVREDLGTLSVEEPDCELYYLAKNAFFGETKTRQIDTMTPDEISPVFIADQYVHQSNTNSVIFSDYHNIDVQVPRNDLPLLKSKLAEIAAKHGRQPRVLIPLRGEWTAGQWIGYVVESYQDSTHTHRPDATVTKISYAFGSNRITTVYAGEIRTLINNHLITPFERMTKKEQYKWAQNYRNQRIKEVETSMRNRPLSIFEDDDYLRSIRNSKIKKIPSIEEILKSTFSK